ncbi:MAG: SgcQ protein, partial [Pseudomonadota bacterium]
MSRFLNTFGVAKPVIGMVHLGALPGSPLIYNVMVVVGVVFGAGADVAALKAAVFYAVLFVNENDRP